MDSEHQTILFGVIFLVLIINTTAIFSLASNQGMISGQHTPVPEPAKTSITPVTTPSFTTNQSKVNATPTVSPKATPGPNTTAVVKSVSSSESKKIAEYVKIITPKPSPVTTHIQIQPAIPDRSDYNFTTIYSLKDKDLDTDFPILGFYLANPPLLIDYTIQPLNITDSKYIEYKQLDPRTNKTTFYQTNISTNPRPYENSRFIITVRDKNTNEIVLTDGYGNNFGYTVSNHIELQKRGNYSFEFDGGFGNVSLTLKVKKEGNF